MKHPELCLYNVADGVATLTFNRPERLNGLTGNMELAYFERLLQAEADDEVGAIIVTGAGRGWCPGADLAYTPGEGDLPLPNTVLPNSTPLSINKPIIAAINGACAGAGLGHAMMCDFRIAASGAKFTTAFSQRGLIAEYGLAWHLTQIAGRAVALDLLLTARVALAEEMLDLGLLNRVVPGDDVVAESESLARQLAENVSPASMATIKRQVLIESSMSIEDAMASSNALMVESLYGSDLTEGVMSFLEKRPAAFAPSVLALDSHGWKADGRWVDLPTSSPGPSWRLASTPCAPPCSSKFPEPNSSLLTTSHCVPLDLGRCS